MRRVLIFLFIAEVLFSASIKFEKAYDVALSKALKEDKVLMAVVTQNFCPWCTKFKRITLGDEDIEEMVNENFVPLLLNKDNDELPANIRTRAVPTTFFLDKNGKKLSSVIGFIEPNEFIEDLKDAIKLNKR